MMSFHLSIIDTEEDKTKFEVIYEKYHKLMFYVANQILKDNFLAEDAVHDSFVKFIENLDKIQDVNCHKTKRFVVIIVRNHAINTYNNRKKKWCIPLDEVQHMLFKEDFDDRILGNSHNDMNELGDIGKVIIQLPGKYRDVVTLKFVHELSNREIATLLDINEANVRKRIERAKQKIQALLEKENKNVL